jgi:sulfur relay (sulfurtransferase) complex TusBCD TusD component (DsrE family)
MKLCILLTTSPEDQNSEIVIKLVQAALEAGHLAELFLMDDGVYNAVKKVKISIRFAGLMTKGASIALCGHTAEERGVSAEDCLPGVKYAGQYELACMVNEADRFLMFGG